MASFHAAFKRTEVMAFSKPQGEGGQSKIKARVISLYLRQASHQKPGRYERQTINKLR
ncbi:hypothetical protein [Bradyrhizobium sp. Leo121]|uniref:hypothetical protein n=1 Tax=Bradyrhizobium sp. Leo121 TaxID=1571195 RepID=UPI0013EEEB58|nr:hypothetical protein [Bradyrhizobium sp. Leo121]